MNLTTSILLGSYNLLRESQKAPLLPLENRLKTVLSQILVDCAMKQHHGHERSSLLLVQYETKEGWKMQENLLSQEYKTCISFILIFAMS